MRIFSNLYVQVLIGVALGIGVGFFDPALAVALKPLGDGFIALVKMVIPVVIFVGVAGGIAHMSDMTKFGRVGAKTLIYFEVVSTLALAIGLLIGEIFRPGAGFNADPAKIDASAVAQYLEKARHGEPIAQYLLHLVPNTFVSAFVDGDLLQVLLIAVLTGFGCARLGPFGECAAQTLDDIGKLFFSIFHVILRLAPLGAFGAMAFTVGKFGVAVLAKLAALVAAFYATALTFVVVVLGLIGLAVGFSIFKFLRYIGPELLIVLGTSSSESVLSRIMEKLQRLGASKSVTGFVIPTGYSFNLDGTNIYMTLATLFLAQATNIHLSLQQELVLLGVAMLTSKGASGVTGAGFITLAATLATVPTIPPVSIALIYGVDRFMSECRALTNLIGNGVATLAIARWEGELDREALRRELNAGPPARTAALAEAG